jgi:hypothetical protein
MMLAGGKAEFVTLVESASADENFDSIALDIRFFQLGTMQIKYTGVNSATGKFIPQASIDLVNWCDLIPESDCATTTLLDNCAFYAFDVLPFPYIRLSYKKGSNTAGSFTVNTFWKKANTGGSS